MTAPARTNATTAAAEIIRAHEVGEKRTVTGSKIIYDKVCEACGVELPWDDWRDALAQHQADMLAAAGLLADPTAQTEWGVRWNDVREDGRLDYLACDDRGEAERMIHNNGEPWLPETNPTLVRRTVTPWTVADTPEAGERA